MAYKKRGELQWEDREIVQNEVLSEWLQKDEVSGGFQPFSFDLFHALWGSFRPGKQARLKTLPPKKLWDKID